MYLPCMPSPMKPTFTYAPPVEVAATLSEVEVDRREVFARPRVRDLGVARARRQRRVAGDGVGLVGRVVHADDEAPGLRRRRERDGRVHDGHRVELRDLARIRRVEVLSI